MIEIVKDFEENPYTGLLEEGAGGGRGGGLGGEARGVGLGGEGPYELEFGSPNTEESDL